MNRILLALANRWVARYAAVPTSGFSGVTENEKATVMLTPAVVVTGGSSGIGLALARRFHREGETVVLVARDHERLAAAKATFPLDDIAPVGGQGRVYSIALDVTCPNAPALLDAALAADGLFLDVLVNNAGIGLAGPFDGHSQAEIEALINLNITALTRLTRHAVPSIRARARGGILNVASLGGFVPGPNQAAYYASKAYVCSLTQALAAELAGSGVRVTVLAPGPVDTRFHAARGADQALYRVLLPALSVERTAAAAVTAYRLGRSVCVPGFFPKVLAVVVTVLPHWVTVPLLRLILAPFS